MLTNLSLFNSQRRNDHSRYLFLLSLFLFIRTPLTQTTTQTLSLAHAQNSFARSRLYSPRLTEFRYKEGEHTVESIREDMQQQTDWMSEVKFSLLSVLPYPCLSERLATLERSSVRIAKDQAAHALLTRDWLLHCVCVDACVHVFVLVFNLRVCARMYVRVCMYLCL
jgi:hypothetical protein